MSFISYSINLFLLNCNKNKANHSIHKKKKTFENLSLDLITFAIKKLVDASTEKQETKGFNSAHG